MNQKFLILFLLLIFVTSCGSDDGGSSFPTKSIFSQWTSEDNTVSFDITGQSFGSAFSLSMIVGTGVKLVLAQALLMEMSPRGTISINNCSYTGGGSGDPNCPNLFENSSQPYSYTKTGLILRLCYANSTCENYD